MQDGRTVEVVRLASDGTPNACSFLLGRARRAAAALGYTRVISYTMVAEGGASLRAAGFEQTALLPARDWGDNGRNANRHAAGERARWEATA